MRHMVRISARHSGLWELPRALSVSQAMRPGCLFLLTRRRWLELHVLSVVGSRFCLAMIACVLVAVAIKPSLAADFTLRYINGRAGMFLEGDISPGDWARFLEAAKPLRPHTLVDIDLNSAGGDFGEAEFFAQGLSMANAAGSWIGTSVMANHVCTSGCFLIFACGAARSVDITARIGIHSARDANENIESWASYAVDTWMARLASQCGVPDYLIGKMVTTRANSMYWLTTQDLLAMGVNVSQNGRWLTPPQASQPDPPSRRQEVFLSCSPTLIQKNERDPVVSVVVDVGLKVPTNENLLPKIEYFDVSHRTAKGQVYKRSEQYDNRFFLAEATWSWSGNWTRDRTIHMIGQLTTAKPPYAFTYKEWIFHGDPGPQNSFEEKTNTVCNLAHRE